MRTPDEPDTHTSPRRGRVRPGTAFPRRSPQATWRRRISRAADRLRNRGDDALPPPATSWEQFDERLRAGRRSRPCAANGWPPSTASSRSWPRGCAGPADSGDWSGVELTCSPCSAILARLHRHAVCGARRQRHEAVNSEDVVDALFDVADPPPCRPGRAVTWVPDWDEFGQLARKAVGRSTGSVRPRRSRRSARRSPTTRRSTSWRRPGRPFERIDDEDAAFARLRAALPDDLPPPASPDLVEQAEARWASRFAATTARVPRAGQGGGGRRRRLRTGRRVSRRPRRRRADRARPAHPAGPRTPRRLDAASPVAAARHAGEARQFCVDCRSGGGIVYLLDPAVDPDGPIDDAILSKQVGVAQFDQGRRAVLTRLTNTLSSAARRPTASAPVSTAASPRLETSTRGG